MFRPVLSRFFSAALFALGAAVAWGVDGSSGSGGGTYTWTGAAGDDDFANSRNWAGGAAPGGTAGTEDLSFNSSIHSTIKVPTASLRNILISGAYSIANLYNWDSGPHVLTLTGDISATSSAGSWTFFNSNLDLSLASGLHTITAAANNSVYLYQVSGSGSIVKEGDGTLAFYEGNAANNFAGGLTINGGTVALGAGALAGTGDITFNTGTILFDDSGAVTLANAIKLGAHVIFDSGSNYDGTLTLSGLLTALGENVTFEALGHSALRVPGSLVEGPTGTAYRFTGDNTIVLEGTNTYTGGTTVDGAEVVFFTAAALPATGLITVTNGGYVGLGSPSQQSSFLGRLARASGSGAIGFDSDPDGVLNRYNGAVDLSTFTDTSLYLGTITQAILSGTITPPSGSDRYNFGGHGALFYESSAAARLTGNLSVHAATYGDADQPFVLVLRGAIAGQSSANDYTGGTSADGGGIIFDSSGALPAAGTVGYTQPYYQPESGDKVRSPGSYLGITENAGLSASAWVARVAAGTHQSTSVLGFDSRDIIANLLVRATDGTEITPAINTINGLDLSNLNSSLYLGTATAAIITGTLKTTNNDADAYYFAGYGSGTLTIASTLAGARAVTLGLPYIANSDTGGSVTLAAANTYTGGTLWQSGALHLATGTTTASGAITSGPLGTGALSVATTAGSARLTFGSAVGEVANPVDFSTSYTELRLASENATGTTLSGLISGAGRLVIDSTHPITLSNSANSYTNGTQVTSGTLIATADQALGSGLVQIENNAHLVLTSATPTLSALEGYGDLTVADGAVLTLTQYAYFNGSILGSANNGARLVAQTDGNTIYLGGANAYTGGTRLVSGTLQAGHDSALGTGTVLIEGGRLIVDDGVTLANPISFGSFGGTLRGNGTFGSAITVGPGVTLAPGNSPGTMNFAAGLTWAGGGSFEVEMLSASGAAGVGHDQIAVTGTLVFNATVGQPFSIKLLSISSGSASGVVADFDPNSVYAWTILTTTGGIVDSSNQPLTLDASALTLVTTGFNNSLNGGFFSLTLGNEGKNLVLNFTPAAVPEPATWLLLAAGLGALALLARRRRA